VAPAACLILSQGKEVKILKSPPATRGSVQVSGSHKYIFRRLSAALFVCQRSVEFCQLTRICLSFLAISLSISRSLR